MNMDLAFTGMVVEIVIDAVVVPLTAPVQIGCVPASGAHVQEFGGKSPNKPS